MKKNVYLDHASTTPVRPEVIEAMLPYFKEDFGNPSSIHSFGRKARVAVEEARETLAESINADPGEIYFTAGGTEANNLPILGICTTEFNESGRRKIITSKAEHSCVLEPFAHLSGLGFEAVYMDVGEDSRVSPENIEAVIDDKTAFVSLIHVNNETGAFNDIAGISKILESRKIYFHTDAVQSFGKHRIDVNELGVDSLSISGHKFGGPKGIGAVYVKSGTPLSSMIFGGSQERNRRGGTENVAGIIGLAKAAEISSENRDAEYKRITELNLLFRESIKSTGLEGLRFNGGEESSPYILSLTFSSEFFNNDAEAMLMYLDINGVAASNGAACASGTLKPSHVIISMGRRPEDASGTIRFSLGAGNTCEDIEYAVRIIERMAAKFRKDVSRS